MYATTQNFLKLFGISNLEELPELPRYKIDENEQIVIEDLIEEKAEESKNNEIIEKQEPIEAPMPEREENNNENSK